MTRFGSRTVAVRDVLLTAAVIAAMAAPVAGAPANPPISCGGYDPSTPAAVVNGHAISMNDLITLVMHRDSYYTLGEMIDNYLVDSECERRGIKVPQSVIDDKVKYLSQVNGAPMDQLLKQHHETLEQLQSELRQMQERVMLVIDRVPPTHIAHCSAIMIRMKSTGSPANPTAKDRTEDQALAIAKDVSAQLAAGKDFSDLARKYSDDPSAPSGGDVGLVDEDSRVPSEVIQATSTMKKGDVTKDSIKTADGFYFVKVVSTGEDHPKDEDKIFADTQEQHRETVGRPLENDELNELRAKAKIERNIP